jgi:hypothetical protein
VKKNRTLCYEYKKVNFLEEANVWYAVIYYWWYSSRAVNEVGIQELES